MIKIKSAQDFGEVVRTYRTERGITQDELAQIAGLSRKVIIELEKGKPTIQFNVIEKILSVTDLTLFVEGQE